MVRCLRRLKRVPRNPTKASGNFMRRHLLHRLFPARFSKNRRRDLGSKNDPGGVLEYSPGSNDPGNRQLRCQIE